ncbi:MAG: carcinine hydrolase/isopenicillin-N N-acyltransferase family protein [archaeon]|nr:carcinine hydrolase/isopenicillin-N N-acyltransferase family protein [archaeon]
MEFKGIYVIIATLIIVAALFVGLGMLDGYSAVDNPYNMKQVDSYLFECDAQDLDYDYAYDFFANMTTVGVGPYPDNGGALYADEYTVYQSNSSPTIHKPKYDGGCTGFTKNGFLGRSFDWVYDNASTIVMHVNGAKYDSLAVVSFPNMTKDMCNEIVNGTNNYTDWMKIAPFFTMDGTNEAGLTCEYNVVPLDDANPNSVAAIETKEKLPNVMLTRYCLDNFDDAKEAAEYLRDYCDVYSVDNKALHLLITDKKGQAYIVEFMDGKAEVNEHSIQTNFFIEGVHFRENGTVPTPVSDEGKVIELSNITAHGDGLERYNIVAADYNNLNSVSDFFNTLHKVRYTNAFKPETNPMWCSEFFYNPDLTLDSNVSEFKEVQDIFYDMYLHRDEGGFSFHSIHQSVWDIDKGVLYIEVREQNICHEFKLNG